MHRPITAARARADPCSAVGRRSTPGAPIPRALRRGPYLHLGTPCAWAAAHMKKLALIALFVPLLALGCSSASDEPDGADTESADVVAAAAARTSAFVTPNLSDAEIEDVLASYAHVDPGHVIAANLL